MAEYSFQDRLLFKLVDIISPLIIRFFCAFLDVKILGEEFHKQAAAHPGGYILSFWHEGLFYLVYHFRNLGMRVLISRSKDGEIIARVVECFGYRGVRGSSSRGGAKAAVEAIRILRKGHPLAITPDGPRGPRRRLQPGVLTIAAKSGALILPVGVSFEKMWVFESWDRFRVPQPFSRAVLKFEEPIEVPPGLSPEEMEEISRKVESTLSRIVDEADRQCKPWT